MTILTRLSYGGTAAIVTGMGLIVGLHAATASRATLIGSLLLIAVADNLADSLAIHAYQESERLAAKVAFRSTVTNFLTRFLVAASFVILAMIAALAKQIRDCFCLNGMYTRFILDRPIEGSERGAQCRTQSTSPTSIPSSQPC